MTEDQLQFKCFTWHWNHLKGDRGFLYRNENKTDKGASKAGLGLVKGVSDLNYRTICKNTVLIELKVNGTRHEIQHLESQLNFIVAQQERGAFGIFIFSEDHFKTAMANMYPSGINDNFIHMARASQYYISKLIDDGKKRKVKTVKLDFDFEKY